jgi:hypothetical protein
MSKDLSGGPPGAPRASGAAPGYAMIMLMLAVTILALGLLVALPIWETQLRRDKEEELIFRGNQYVEAVRRFQLKNPGRFPASFEDLEEERYLRKHFLDPMTPTGEWNVVLVPTGALGGRQGMGERPGGGFAPARGVGQGQGMQRVLVAPESALESIQNPMIIGVVSSSTRRSIRIYNDQESYDKWLFFYGLDPKRPPEIVYWGKSEDDRP